MVNTTEDQGLVEDTVANSIHVVSDHSKVDLKTIDLRFLISFAGSDVEKQKKYVRIFLENSPKLLNQIETGWQNADYESIKISAHSLKTQLNYMGVKEEKSHIFELEQMASHTHRREEMESLIKNLKLVCSQAFKELAEFLV